MLTRTPVAERLFSAALVSGCVLASSATAGAASYYQVTDLGNLGGDFCAGFGKSSVARALNENGQAVGNSCIFVGFFQRVNHAFSWSGGVMTDLGTLDLGGPGTYDHSFASGNNDSGQIVGRDYLFSETEAKAFLWSGGTMTSLDAALGGGFSSALDINNAGQIVGLRGVPPDVASWSAFLYDTATDQVTSLPGLGGTFRTSAVAINDAGEAVGSSSTAIDPNVFHAVKWTGNVPGDLGTLGGTHSFANGLNGIGQVVGQSWMPGDFSTHAFLWSGGSMQDLGTLGGSFSSANALTTSGEVVGTSSTASSATHAFIFESGVMSDLNDRISPSAGFVLVEATAINESGEIVGHGLVGDESHAFLLTPSSPPPDLAPPVLSVPADFTVEAPSQQGAFVTYHVTAVDDVDPHPMLACVPPSGSTFPIGVTKVECVATDNTGKSASASFNVTVLPPFDLALGLPNKLVVGKKTGIVSVQGSIACNRSAFVSISGQLTETVAHRALLQGQFGLSLFCTAPSTAWTATVQAFNGSFGAGPADLQASAFGCGSACDTDEKHLGVLIVGGPR